MSLRKRRASGFYLARTSSDERDIESFNRKLRDQCPNFEVLIPMADTSRKLDRF
jgi:hypothetical protein